MNDARRTLVTVAMAAIVSSPAFAASKNSGYVTESSDAVVISGAGLCWRTPDWTPARAAAAAACRQCSPDLCPVAAAPEPPPRPATPAPVPVAPPAPPVQLAPVQPQRISLAADTLFGFDQAILRAEGQSELDEFVRRLQGVNFESILVIGHTDRIGSASYNQKLSQRRADAVRTYLVGKGIPAERIRAEGRGAAEPVTKSGQCPGRKSPKVIQCLQPDRRVDVEVSGTKQ